MYTKISIKIEKLNPRTQLINDSNWKLTIYLWKRYGLIAILNHILELKNIGNKNIK